jgi:hypothetical protein
MQNLKRNMYGWLRSFGFDPLMLFKSLKGLSPYMKDRRKLLKQGIKSKFHFPLGPYKPCLVDRFDRSGIASGHYFHQDLLVAQRIFDRKPKIHVDVASRVDGFVAHCASFREIKVIDIRSAGKPIKNIDFLQADMMGPIPRELEEYCDSLSCLHALEHFGLGRYGDPINYDGYLLGLVNLHKILKKDGILYLSVPIGAQRIEFNAHRVFSMTFILKLIEQNFNLVNFSYVDDFGDLHENVKLEVKNVESNFNLNYGCGIFEMKKT